jgi:cell division protein FtsX
MNVWSLPLKNVRNNRLRSVLVMLGVAAAIFVFCFFESVQLTMASVVEQAGRNNNVVSIKENTW